MIDEALARIREHKNPVVMKQEELLLNDESVEDVDEKL